MWVAAVDKRNPGGWIASGSVRRVLAALLLAPYMPMGFASLADNLADLSLEELGNLQITSVSKHGERLSDAAASIFVITGDDIRRSGATTLPEVLRLAPNLEVARVNAGAYAISARGFNNAIGNKLLVLIDGRTVYTPLFSGVNWDAQNVMLDDVERIEVISGPGATLWGANAVNGVINVITRGARDTQGGLVNAGGGNRGSDTAVRYGGSLGGDGYYRVYGMGFEQAHTKLGNGKPVQDGRSATQAGFRADWGRPGHGLTWQGDAYASRMERGPIGAPTQSGMNMLLRWQRQSDDGAGLQVQAYYDHVKRDDPLTLRDEVDTYDFEAQHEIPPFDEHRILWGGGYRYASDSTQTHFNPINLLPQALIPADKSLHWANLFVQDEISLASTLKLTLGLKAEGNDYTGVEYLPSLRLAWKPKGDALVWGALSRAVRAPARIDRDFHLYLQLPNRPLIPIIKGGPDFDSEVAVVIEIGYRAEPSTTLSYSLTLFRSFYDKLRSGQRPPAFVQNMMYGTTGGIEAWGSYQLARQWRVSGGLTLLTQRIALRPGSLDPTGPSALGNDPANWWSLRSEFDLTSECDFDVMVRHVGPLPNPAVPQYTAVDARLAWRPTHGLELSWTLQSLFDPAHVEFGAPAAASELDRGGWIRAKWNF